MKEIPVEMQEIMEKIVDIKAENITLGTPNLPKTPANILPTPLPENMDFRKIVRSQFI